MVIQNIDTSASNRESFRQNPSGASALSGPDRRHLSVQALRQIHPITRIAQQHDVSRKFVYGLYGDMIEALLPVAIICMLSLLCTALWLLAAGAHLRSGEGRRA